MRWAALLSVLLACSPVLDAKPTTVQMPPPAAPEERWPAADAAALVEMATMLCRGEGPMSRRTLARKILGQHGEAAVERLLAVTVSPGACHEDVIRLIADIVFNSQVELDKAGVTSAFSPVRAALESGDDRWVVATLPVLGRIGEAVDSLMRTDALSEIYRPADQLVDEIVAVLARLNRNPGCGTVVELERETARFSRAHHQRLSPSPPKGRGASYNNVGHPLSQRILVCRMLTIKSKVAACYAQHNVPGTVMLSVVISPEGKVSAATATGMFAATPTGACVEDAVKSVSFPPSDGLTTPYPFVLR